MKSEIPYKIYEYALNVADEHDAPHHIDFEKDLSIRLHPKNTFVRGELVECTHYASFDGTTYSTPVVRERWTYYRDGSGYATHRDHLIDWYMADGTIGPHPKTRTKYYSSLNDKREEVARKKKNQTTKASEVVIGALMMGGISYETAVGQGFAYWKSLVNEVNEYENGNSDPLLARLNNDTSPAWLPSIRSFVVAEL